MARAKYVLTFRIRGDRPGIGAVVAMVAASQQRWVTWAKRLHGEWCSFAPHASCRAAKAYKLSCRDAFPMYSWQVLPEGVKPDER